MNAFVKQVLITFVFASFVLLPGVASEGNINGTTTSTTPTANNNASTTTSPTNSTSVKGNPVFPEKDTNGLLERSLYVAIGISVIVAIYFIVRAVKTRGRRKAKKYGVIHGTGSMELQPLDKDVEEEEEDMTLFDRKEAKWPH